MSTNDLSIPLLLLIGGLGSVAGYWLRRVQKLEDKEDEINFTDLPALYNSIYSFDDHIKLFLEDGQLDTFKDNIDKTIDSMKEQIFSGNILLLEPVLHKELKDFYSNAKEFQYFLKQIEGMDDSAKEDYAANLSHSFKEGDKYNGINHKQLKENAGNLNEKIRAKLESYKSISLKLTIIIFILGVIMAVIDFYKK